MTPEAQQFIADCNLFGVNPNPWDRFDKKLPHHPLTVVVVNNADHFDVEYLTSVFCCFEQRSGLSPDEALRAYCCLLDVVFELEDARNEKEKDRA